jgi:hypothetical protein
MLTDTLGLVVVLPDAQTVADWLTLVVALPVSHTLTDTLWLVVALAVKLMLTDALGLVVALPDAQTVADWLILVVALPVSHTLTDTLWLVVALAVKLMLTDALIVGLTLADSEFDDDGEEDSITHVELLSLQTPLAQSESIKHVPSVLRRRSTSPAPSNAAGSGRPVCDSTKIEPSRSARYSNQLLELLRSIYINLLKKIPYKTISRHKRACSLVQPCRMLT